MPKQTVDEQKIALITIPCPEEIFEAEGVTIRRRKRVAVWKMDALKAAKLPEDVYAIVAGLVPTWDGVCDVDTGEQLANPADDPSVLSKLDGEQLTWIIQALNFKWSDFRPTRSAQM
ncbi:MAG: hypothetical protein KJ063_02380 [Anaerolineae bacterium]|nr:hypothetical protein [Anaerolineae bacterium]